VERPHNEYFRYGEQGVLVAKPRAHVEKQPLRRLSAEVRRVLFGAPLASENELEQRLGKRKALAIFSSDAISSSAYATEEILRVLVLAGAAAMLLSLEIAIAIALLLAVVAFSYRQVIRREYDIQARELAVPPDRIIGPLHRRERVIVPVPGITRAVVQAINFARAISDDVRAVHVTDDAEAGAALRRAWDRQVPGLPLVIVESPYRALIAPFLSYLDVMVPPEPDMITIVVLPGFVARHWWDRALHNQTANRLREALIGRPDTVVANVPYRRDTS
jgi:hypothetical protein